MKNKHLSKLFLSLAISVVGSLPLYASPVVSAAANAELSLSPAKSSVARGSDLVVTVNLNSGGNAVFAWQASLSYPAGSFSSVSISTAKDSPFNANTGGDTTSAGVIKMARFSTSPKAYDGPVATVTMRASAAGTAAIAFDHICTSTSDTTPCSTVVDGSSTNLLGTSTGSSITITESSAPPTTSQSGSATGTSDNSKSVIVQIFDDQKKPVANATVTIGGVTGKTDKNGQVTLSGLPAGKAEGTVTYNGKTKKISTEVSSDPASPSKIASFSVDSAKKSSSNTPAVAGIIVGVLVLLGLVLFYRRRGTDRPEEKTGGFTKRFRHYAPKTSAHGRGGLFSRDPPKTTTPVIIAPVNAPSPTGDTDIPAEVLPMEPQPDSDSQKPKKRIS